MSNLRRLTLPCLAIGLALGLSACAVFRLPTLQGNVLEQKQVDKLEIGMTPDQVRFLLGSPLVQDSFDPDHWDYVYYFRSSRGLEAKRVLSLFFDNAKLVRIVGQEAPAGFAGSETPTTAPEETSVDNAPLPDQEKGSTSEDRDSPISLP